MGLVWSKNGNSTRNGKITDMPLGLLEGIPNFKWINGDFMNLIFVDNAKIIKWRKTKVPLNN